MQFLARDQKAQEELVAHLASMGLGAYKLTLESNRTIRKAIIPVAGFGTRMYPETRFVKKEFLPVRDRDGLIKPALLILLEELDAAGIERICLVIHPDERKQYEALLAPIGEAHYAKLPAQMQSYEQRLSGIMRKVEFVEQSEAKGFGHAVYQAAEFAAGEPVLLLLGDTIYRSRSDTCCARQLMDAFARSGEPTVALCSISPDSADRYGVLSGEWESAQEDILRCTRMVEKPTPAYAREFLMTKTRNGAQLYGVFGLYALTGAVFERLKAAIEHEIVNERGEVELTEALAWLAENQTLTGVVLDGESFDLGNPAAYKKAFCAFDA